MRIDSPKGIKSWLIGFFSGSFKGNLEGTASYAVTASYVETASVADNLSVEGYTNLVDELSTTFVKVHGDENITGSLTISGSSPQSLKVLGKVILAGDTEVSGILSVAKQVDIGNAKILYHSGSGETEALEITFLG